MIKKNEDNFQKDTYFSKIFTFNLKRNKKSQFHNNLIHISQLGESEFYVNLDAHKDYLRSTLFSNLNNTKNTKTTISLLPIHKNRFTTICNSYDFYVKFQHLEFKKYFERIQ